jgi:NAD(P)-dependent dehydrogenase (short-subunit alcohol dehydrogenase family)
MLKGKTVVVTAAAGTGIGFAAAKRAAEEGAKLLISDFHERRLNEAADRIADEAGVKRPAIFVCDVTNEDAVQGLRDASLAALGKVDVLINNAGIFIAKPTIDYTEQDVESIVSTNLKGFFYITQQAVRHMVEHRSGHIINITASIAMQPTTAVPALLPVLIKGGLNQATRALALELAAHNVKVNAVAPGIIETPLHAPGSHDFLKAQQPAGRIGQVDDIVGAVQYLTDSSFTTGAILPVDGGASSGRW